MVVRIEIDIIDDEDVATLFELIDIVVNEVLTNHVLHDREEAP